jgi:hypothetical protein
MSRVARQGEETRWLRPTKEEVMTMRGLIRSWIVGAMVLVPVGSFCTNVWAATNSLDGVVFSVETDKKVYAYTEPVQIAVMCDNPSDELEITTSTVSLTVVNLATNKIVYTVPISAYDKQLSTRAKKTVLIGEIPAYTLQSGNKKYRIEFAFFSTDLRYLSNGATFRIYNKASTVIKVK